MYANTLKTRLGKIFLSGNILALIAVIFATSGVPALSEEKNGETTILAIGDSLTAGYGLPPGEGYPEQLALALKDKGYAVDMINAGVSGDTSSGGLSRLEWVLDSINGGPDLVILEFGANDALRGIDPVITEGNLDRMLSILTERKIPVLFAGMLAPPNMGPDYAARFDPIYPQLAKKYNVSFYPFFLDGVAGDTSLNQSDGMHPDEEGVAVIVEKILSHVLPFL
ncbi:arylesterase [Emcibacter nanhaiensis]|uniref:Arylesterase n=1 Tax=Emcibacter nanhaiensis TaxID=1505037 RepID=A0A501PRX0_9PROT|nr:arylesterase [Emcibacter nanhaiensis]